MAPPPMEETVSASSDDVQATLRSRPHASRRRDKAQLSCDLCRRRKLRCDRQQPCSTCSSRGQICTFPEDAAPSLATPGMHQRLLQLERLVMSIAAQSNTTHQMPFKITSQPVEPPQADTLMSGPTDRGIMLATDSPSHYVGGDHWAAILESIAELKENFDRQEQMRISASPEQAQSSAEPSGPIDNQANTHSLLLYGGYGQLSNADIIAALPPRVTVDRYVSRYFNRQEMISSVVHGPTFLRKYEAFWDDPSAVPISWIGLLYGMLCLAALASDPSDTAYGYSVEQQALQVSIYREKVAQCLISSEYTQGGPYVLEAMIHHVYIEFAVRADADKDVWFLLALEVNLAMRMGCHRDPSNFPGQLTPLESEMRRRVWTIVLQCDVLISSQMGMPRMISDWQCDTAEPRNLNDSDLDHDTSEIPLSRPETEITTVLGTIARRRMLNALAIISNTMANVQSCEYADILQAEAKLHDAAASIPPPFRMKSMTNSLIDPPQMVMSRLFLSHLFYKGQISLHRRFVLPPSLLAEDLLSHSLRVCVDASLAMLNIQQVLHEETRQGGRLDILRWRLSSVLKHQFLTATMMLCSLLYRGKTLQRDEEIMMALQNSRGTWLQSNAFSEEARKAADTISFVLAKAGESQDRSTYPSVSSTSIVALGEQMTGQGSVSEVTPSMGDQNLLRDALNLYDDDKSEQQLSQFAFNLNAWESGAARSEAWTFNPDGTMW